MSSTTIIVDFLPVDAFFAWRRTEQAVGRELVFLAVHFVKVAVDPKVDPSAYRYTQQQRRRRMTNQVQTRGAF